MNILLDFKPHPFLCLWLVMGNAYLWSTPLETDTSAYQIEPVNLFAIARPSHTTLSTPSPTGHIGQYTGHGLWIKQQYPGGLTTLALQGAKASHTKVFWEGVRLNSPFNGGFNFSDIGLSAQQQIAIHHNHQTVDAQDMGGSVHITESNLLGTPHKFNSNLRLTRGNFGLMYSNGTVSLSSDSTATQIEVQSHSIENNYPYHYNGQIHTLKNAQIDLQQLKWLWAQRGSQYMYKAGLLLNANTNQIPASVSAAESEAYSTSKMLVGFSKLDYLSTHWKYSQNTSWQTQDYRYMMHSQADASTYVFSKFNSTHSLQINTTNRSQFIHLLADYDYIYTSEQTLVSNPSDHRYQLHLGYAALDNRIKAYVGSIRSESLKNTDLTWSLVATQPLKGVAGDYYVQFSYHRKFQLPTFNDLYYPNQGNLSLRPERADIVGLSQRWIPFARTTYTLEVSLDANYSDIQDLIVWKPNSASQFSPYNVSRAQQFTLRSSLDLSTHIQYGTIEQHLGSQWNATYQFTQDALLGKQLIYTPNLNLGIVVSSSFSLPRFPQFLDLRLAYDYQSASYIDFQNTATLDPFYLLHLDVNTSVTGQMFAFLRDTAQLSLGLSIRNINNQVYQLYPGFPQAGRQYLFNFSIHY